MLLAGKRWGGMGQRLGPVRQQSPQAGQHRPVPVELRQRRPEVHVQRLERRAPNQADPARTPETPIWWEGLAPLQKKQPPGS